MGWETIENVKPKYTKASVPVEGLRIGTRRAMRDTRFIEVKIGMGLARRARFASDRQQVRLMFGTGPDAGKVGVSVDQGGAFVAQKAKRFDYYTLTINRAAAEGRFALAFDPFTLDRVEAIRPENGQPPMFTFRASAQMLAAEAE